MVEPIFTIQIHFLGMKGLTDSIIIIRFDTIITTDWGEYSLIRTTTGAGMNWLYNGIDNRGGKDNGYFFYVDASEKTGKIADLKN